MTSQHYNIGVIGLGAVGFILQFTDILFKTKERKWYKRISAKGWVVLLVAGFASAFSYFGLGASNAEKKISDSISDANSRGMQNSMDSILKTNRHVDSILRVVYHLQITKNNKGGVTIIGTPASNNANPTTCPIEVWTRDGGKLNMNTQTLCNGEKIPLQYQVSGMKFTVPYMKGKNFAGGFVMDNISIGSVGFDKNTGTFDLSNGGVSGSIGDSSHIVFTANIPQRSQFMLITVSGIKGNGVSYSYQHDFFDEDVTQISHSSQSYILGSDFTQNKSTRTITWTNGGQFRNGDIVRVSR